MNSWFIKTIQANLNYKASQIPTLCILYNETIQYISNYTLYFILNDEISTVKTDFKFLGIKDKFIYLMKENNIEQNHTINKFIENCLKSTYQAKTNRSTQLLPLFFFTLCCFFILLYMYSEMFSSCCLSYSSC